ncbi:MAG: hypothetical protein MI923_11625 [Phycisphaerales bacterium]|nr:hypothetical protein [Phycisphaerales bacterium]
MSIRKTCCITACCWIVAGASGCLMPDLGDFGPTGPLTVMTSPGAAATGTGSPLFNEITRYTTTLSTNGDPADFYFPTDATSQPLPVALLLQGANVEKSNYIGFASTVASYGFIVVVPNHAGLFGLGLFVELNQIRPVLDFLDITHSGEDVVLNGVADTSRLVLLGHSFGGAAALNAVQDACTFPFCSGIQARPTELLGAAVYGANLANPTDGNNAVAPITNAGIPVAILQGNLDGVADLSAAMSTFEQLQDPPNAMITVLGANHFGLNDENNPEGTVTDPNAPTLTQQVAVETIGRWAALFLRAFALGDPDARQYVLTTGPMLDPNVSSVIEP